MLPLSSSLRTSMRAYLVPSTTCSPVKTAGLGGDLLSSLRVLLCRISLMVLEIPPSAVVCTHSFLVVNASRRVMEIEAEHIKLMKQDFT